MKIKPIIAGLLLVALAMVIGILEKESAITADSLSKDPPVISKMIYPCETWIRQTGAGPPLFSCVKAIQQ